VPLARPVTVPDEDMVATVVFTLLHVPPDVPEFRFPVPLTHSVRGPPYIGAGIGFTVAIIALEQPVGRV
jgi:hypothetical protein